MSWKGEQTEEGESRGNYRCESPTYLWLSLAYLAAEGRGEGLGRWIWRSVASLSNRIAAGCCGLRTTMDSSCEIADFVRC